MPGAKFNMPSEKEFRFREDVGDVLHKIDQVVYRIKAHAKAQVSQEYAQAELEGREVQVGYGSDSVREIVMTACMRIFGGVQGELTADEGADNRSE